MNLKEEKELALKEIEDVNDVETIKLIRQIIQMANENVLERDLKPFTKEELIARTLKAEEDIKAGRLFSADEIRQEVKSWRNAS
jgi:hypothetical protein